MEEFLRDQWDIFGGWRHLLPRLTTWLASAPFFWNPRGRENQLLPAILWPWHKFLHPSVPVPQASMPPLKLHCQEFLLRKKRKQDNGLSAFQFLTTWYNHSAKEGICFYSSWNMVGWSQWYGPVGQSTKRADSKTKVFTSWPRSQRGEWDFSYTIPLRGTTPRTWKPLAWFTLLKVSLLPSSTAPGSP